MGPQSPRDVGAVRRSIPTQSTLHWCSSVKVERMSASTKPFLDHDSMKTHDESNGESRRKVDTAEEVAKYRSHRRG